MCFSYIDGRLWGHKDTIARRPAWHLSHEHWLKVHKKMTNREVGRVLEIRDERTRKSCSPKLLYLLAYSYKIVFTKITKLENRPRKDISVSPKHLVLRRTPRSLSTLAWNTCPSCSRTLKLFRCWICLWETIMPRYAIGRMNQHHERI
jgi:hypothetical protein